MRVLRYSMPMAVVTAIFFMAVVPQKTYAQASADINKNPAIILDKRAIEIDRRLLKAAQQAKDPERIRECKLRLKHDIARLKLDKKTLTKKKKQ